MMASGKPQPLSLIRSDTWPPECSVDTSIFGSLLPERASWAFCSRLWITCRRRSGSPRTGGMPLCRQPIQIQPIELRRGRARIVAEVIHHVLQRSHLRDDGLGGAIESLRRFYGKLVGELRLQALRGELDRCERILDLVGESARNLAPGGCAL